MKNVKKPCLETCPKVQELTENLRSLRGMYDAQYKQLLDHKKIEVTSPDIDWMKSLITKLVDAITPRID